MLFTHCTKKWALSRFRRLGGIASQSISNSCLVQYFFFTAAGSLAMSIFPSFCYLHNNSREKENKRISASFFFLQFYHLLSSLQKSKDGNTVTHRSHLCEWFIKSPVALQPQVFLPIDNLASSVKYFSVTSNPFCIAFCTDCYQN